MIKASHLKHRYTVWEGETESKRTALDDVSMDVRQGEFVAILGPNGSGKSTFAKHLNVILTPESGSLWVDGKDASDAKMLMAIRDTVGMVFQNPDNQLIGTSVEEDTAFGPEQRNLPPEEIRSRVAASLGAVGLLEKRTVSPFRLSGGQKQRLAIAGTLAADTSCIVLDEPTAMLDPASRRDVMEILGELHRQGKTLILITHHTDEVLGADRIILMNRGKVVGSGTPAEIFSQPELLKSIRMDMPAVTETAFRLAEAGVPLSLPVLTNEDLAEQLSTLLTSASVGRSSETFMTQKMGEAEPGHAAALSEREPLLSARGLNFAYGKGTVNESEVIKGLDLDIYAGEFLGLAGTSGAGKTTLAKHLNGLLRAQSGNVVYEGRSIYEKKYPISNMRKEVGLVFQNPEQQLFCRTLLKDVCYGPRNMGMSEEEAIASAKECLALVGIDESYYEASPYEMSGGQMRRAAIAGILAMKPKILILDEPAAGLDPGSKQDILQLLDRIRRERGTAIVLISHDMEDLAEYAERIVVLHDGTIAAEGTPAEVFGDADKVREIGLGVPEITLVMEELAGKGVGLPETAVTVQQATDMLCGMFCTNAGAETIASLSERHESATGESRCDGSGKGGADL